MHQKQQPRWAEPEALRLAAACVIVGSLVVFAFRIAHGDAPAADPEAQLRFIAEHRSYVGVHLGTIVGVLAWLGGFVAFSGTLRHPVAGLLGRMGLACMLVGGAIFITDFTIDGVAGQDLAREWAAAQPAARDDVVVATRTASTMIRGTSLISIALLWGLPLLIFARAVTLDGYAAWLGWTAAVAGSATVVGATALLLQPTLFPGVLVYGLLASVVVQVWSVALGIAMWRRAAGAGRIGAQDRGSAR
jgi:hypothetical protein